MFSGIEGNQIFAEEFSGWINYQAAHTLSPTCEIQRSLNINSSEENLKRIFRLSLLET